MTVESRTGRGRWWVLAAAALGSFVAAVMGTSVNVAMPSLVSTTGAPFALVQWVVLAYLLTTAAMLPIVGRLADMWGKRAIFVAGFGIFALGSLATGLAPSVGALIAFRLVHGLGSAVLTGVGLAIVTDVFPSEERGRAIGINGAVLSSGIVLGPTLGGFLVEFGWRWVFLAGLPFALAGALVAWRYVPAYLRGPPQRFDLAGAATMTAALASVSLALTLGQGRGFGDGLVLALFATGALLAAAFTWVERRGDHPIVDLSLFRDPRLTIGLVAGLGVFVSIAGTIFVMPFYLEGVLGRPPREVGLLMSVTPILLVILAPVAGVLADRFGERIVTVVGLAFAFAGFSAVGTLSETTTALGYVLRFVPVGIGMATFQTPNNSAIMGAAPAGRSGIVGGLLGLTRAMGQTSGIAVLGSVWAARSVFHAGGSAEAALVPGSAQVLGLHDMMTVVQALILAALVLCAWDLARRPPAWLSARLGGRRATSGRGRAISDGASADSGSGRTTSDHEPATSGRGRTTSGRVGERRRWRL